MATQESKIASHGRGGAGNLAPDAQNYPKPEDLVTPTLKSENYTTGRGGKGNMAKNDNPEEARRAQDVEGAPPTEPVGPKHYGRGGAANVIDKDQRKSAEGTRKKSVDETPATNGNGNGKGLIAKGKEFLNKLGGKK